MKNLNEEINALSREQVIEAATFFNRAIIHSAEAGEAENKALENLTLMPSSYIAELEELSRVILLAAASMPEFEEDLHKAILGTGKKLFILGGTEIVILAAFALMALQIIVTKGKAEETEKKEIISKDGKVVKISKTVKYDISSRLGDILKSYLGSK